VLKHPSLIGRVWLRLAEGVWISGEALSKELRVSKVAIWKAVKKLNSLGYVIESERGKGYRLLSEPNVPHPWRVARNLKTKVIGSFIIFIDEVPSTQDLIKNVKGEGSVLFANRQRKGRGRLGRSWFSTEKDLKLSILLKPSKVPPSNMGFISLIAGLAVCRAIGGRLKWPNDVLLDGKKVAGILVEGEAQQDRLEKVYVGIGINVNSTRGLERFEATSLKLHTSKETDLAELAANVLNHFEPLYFRLLEGKTPLDEVKEVMDTIGRKVRVVSFGEAFGGVAKDVDESGSLLVELNGSLKRVSVGDVVHLRG